MNERKFNLLCISAVIVVAAIAVVMVELGPEGKAIQAPGNVDLGQFLSSESTSNPFVPQPLSLPLALAVVFDMGLMTLGLVILFSDQPLVRRRYRTR